MSGRRRTAVPQAQPYGAPDPQIAPAAPPEEFIPPDLPPQGVSQAEEAIMAGAGTEEAPQPPGVEDQESLSPEEEVMFASLLTCGRRTKVVKVLDHIVVVQTLNCDDDLRIGLYIKDYQGSIGEQRAYQVAVAAAGITTIDGAPLVQTLYADADQDALFQEKVNKVAKMYPHVVQRIYRAVMDAEKEFVELVTRLGKLEG